MCFVAVQMGGTNALQRVAALLLMYAEQTAYLPEEPCLQLSQEQVASLVNLSRAQVARVYQRLRQENIIQSGRNYVIVKDPGRLEQYGGLL
jgi:CRP-like cAMP-binding protein